LRLTAEVDDAIKNPQRQDDVRVMRMPDGV
jgi:hypothetical protein